MATSDDLRQIFTAGRPLIEEWLGIGEQIAALRDVAASKGLDWSQLKALMKAQIQDERDETGNGKRVARIVEKAEFASAYADMLGLANMNENNFSEASQSYAEVKGVDADPKLIETIVKGVQTEIGRKAIITALDAMIDAETGEITEHEQPETASQFPSDAATVANTEQADVDRSAERASSAVEVGAPVSPEGATRRLDDLGSVQDGLKMSTDGHAVERRISEGSSQGEAEDAGVTAGETAPHSNPQPTSSPDADKTGEVVPPASPVAISDADVPAFLKKGKTDKPDCLKLKDGHCKIAGETSALCSDCNNARMKARAA